MAAGACYGYLETPRRNGLGGHVIGGRAIHCNYGREALAVGFHEGANAAQVPFTLFANIAREDDCLRGANARIGKRARQSGKGGKACAVVRDPRSFNAVSVSLR